MNSLRLPVGRVEPLRSAALSLVFVGCVYLGSLATLDLRSFWVGDNAVKFLQVEALLTSGFRDFALPWPGHGLDTDYVYNPLPAPFSRVEEGRLFAQYSPAFTVVSALLFGELGLPGLYLLPLVGMLTALGGVAALARSATCAPAARHAAVLIAALGTPLWFYAVEYWEHALALGASLWAIHFVQRFLHEGACSNLAVAGALLAIATAFREESLLLAVVLFVFVLREAPRSKSRALLAFGAALGVTLAPLLLFQGWAVGNPFGLHVGSNLSTLAGYFTTRGEVVYRLLLAAGPNPGRSLLLTGPFLIAFLWRPRLSPALFRVALPAAALVALAAAALTMRFLAHLPDYIARLMSSNSLFPAAPVLSLALLGCRQPPSESAKARVLDQLHWIAVGYALVYSIAAPEISTGGIHWGNRFLLIVYPLLVVLAAANLELWRGFAGRRAVVLALPLLLVVAASCAAQVGSIVLLRAKKEFSGEVRRELARHPEPVIVTDLWWGAQELFTDFYRRPIFFVRSRRQWADLASLLRANGIERVLLATRARAQPALAGGVTLSSRGLDYYALTMRGVPLAPAAVVPPAGSAPHRADATCTVCPP